MNCLNLDANQKVKIRPPNLVPVIWGMIAACLLFSSPAEAVSVRHDRPVNGYVNLSTSYPTVGFLGDAPLSEQFCTGTLVSSTRILTAAHCIDGDSDGQEDVPANEMTFGLAPNVPFFFSANIASAAIHPAWVSSGGDPSFDLAVLTLAVANTSVGPSRVYAGDPTGLVGTMIGYGEQGTGSSFPSSLVGATNKLAAENIIDFFGTGSAGTTDIVVETDFDSPAGNRNTTGSPTPLLLEGTTGPGDSGGPLFVRVGFRDVLVGVLNGGQNALGDDSEYGDIATWAAIGSSANLSFLASQGITPFVPGDYNLNGSVGPEDYAQWTTDFGSTTVLHGDGNNSGVVDAADYTVWRDLTVSGQIVPVPEPASWLGIWGWACYLLAARYRLRDDTPSYLRRETWSWARACWMALSRVSRRSSVLASCLIAVANSD